jgi:hypothetical protein
MKIKLLVITSAIIIGGTSYLLLNNTKPVEPQSITPNSINKVTIEPIVEIAPEPIIDIVAETVVEQITVAPVIVEIATPVAETYTDCINRLWNDFIATIDVPDILKESWKSKPDQHPRYIGFKCNCMNLRLEGEKF